jgi:hypothetical protein
MVRLVVVEVVAFYWIVTITYKCKNSINTKLKQSTIVKGRTPTNQTRPNSILQEVKRTPINEGVFKQSGISLWQLKIMSSGTHCTTTPISDSEVNSVFSDIVAKTQVFHKLFVHKTKTSCFNDLDLG